MNYRDGRTLGQHTKVEGLCCLYKSPTHQGACGQVTCPSSASSLRSDHSLLLDGWDR